MQQLTPLDAQFLGVESARTPYEDVIGVGIVTDREQVAEPWPLLDGIKRALDEPEGA